MKKKWKLDLADKAVLQERFAQRKKRIELHVHPDDAILADKVRNVFVTIENLPVDGALGVRLVQNKQVEKGKPRLHWEFCGVQGVFADENPPFYLDKISGCAAGWVHARQSDITKE